MPIRSRAHLPLALALLVALPCSAGEGSRQRLVFDLVLRQKPVGNQSLERARSLRGGPHQSHACDLINYDNVQYHLEVQIGHPCSGGIGQRFQVVPDTGSSDLWIPSSKCEACKGIARYDISKSCTAKPLGNRVSFRYGDGTTASGGSFVDTVQLGDLEVKEQVVIQVDEVASTTHMKADGILGLAHHYNSEDTGRRTFMSTLFTEHPDLPRQFSFFLTGDTSQPSQLIFGDPDITSHAKDPEFVYGKAYYMSHTELWLTSVWSIGWSDTGVEVSFPDRGVLGQPAMFDSGSSLIVLAPEIYDRLIEDLKWRFTGCRELPKQQVLSCDCPPANDLSRIPSLVITMIDADDRKFGLCLAPDEFILESLAEEGSSCVPALQRGTAGQPVPLIFGMTFMRAYYTNFDLVHSRIGFARNRESPLPSGAVCAVASNTLARRLIWLASFVTAIASVLFAFYVICCPSGFSCGTSANADKENTGSTGSTGLTSVAG